MSVETFREQAFIPSVPTLMPGRFAEELLALNKWFVSDGADKEHYALNYSYLSRFGRAIVPLEFTRLLQTEAGTTFVRSEAPLEVFLEWSKQAKADTPERLYLAQASFTDLPTELKADLPTPEIVAKAGKGDIYDTNLWIGVPPTYTPLHRDPNPNLFIQLAGKKNVRLLDPEAGLEIFARVQAALGKSGSPAFRGEEMMQGEEKALLESHVWDNAQLSHGQASWGFEAYLERGDGLFIPKGWWHSIKGVGEGITGSVSL